MRGAAAIYLLAGAAALTAAAAHGLQCYICQTPTLALQCNATRNCTEHETWCYTTVYGAGGYPFNKNRLVVRGCAEICEGTNPNNLGVTRPTLCCQDSLCNDFNKVSDSKIVPWETILIGISVGIVILNWG
ncbi:ly6/PLAUR domain-containing protein 2-like [Dendrobates tinctorius]|uniref:ly6/PLAUR domain-containing protein 2-like n=1 Tax=Dendrobates tinctorius TaxID=92724 RepID=UPI003CCA1CDC